MSSPLLRAIECQLRAIVRVAIENDALRLFIRGAIRNALADVERPGASAVIRIPDAGYGESA
jgi:hypothetical protein